MYQFFKYILILLFLQLTFTVVAQDYTLSSRVLENQNDLLEGRINSIHEDSDGFIWMLTQRGIVRYDGHQFKWITKINSNLREVPDRDFIVEDDAGYLWFASSTATDLIHSKTLEVISLEERFGENLPFKSSVSQLKEGKNNYIILKTIENRKWYSYHSSTGFVELPFLGNDVRTIEIEGDNIWALSKGELAEKFNIKTGKKLKEFATHRITKSYRYINGYKN